MSQFRSYMLTLIFSVLFHEYMMVLLYLVHWVRSVFASAVNADALASAADIFWEKIKWHVFGELYFLGRDDIRASVHISGFDYLQNGYNHINR